MQVYTAITHNEWREHSDGGSSGSFGGELVFVLVIIGLFMIFSGGKND